MRDWLAKSTWLLPGTLGGLAALALGLWLLSGAGKPLSIRVPGTDHAPGSDLGTNQSVVQAGKLVPGPGKAADLPGSWPQFRGPNLDGIGPEPTKLLRSWGAAGPRELWALDVGEGYAGAAVNRGRVYLMDYDQTNRLDALRCLSLQDGQEIWRFTYPVAVKRNHGMSRTVPAVNDQILVAMGPKCHVVCLHPVTGEFRWGIDLVRQFGTTVPPWYAGQCPLIDQDKVILAPGGKNSLLLAVASQTGEVLWQSLNPRGWKMTHSSVVPMEVAGERMYVYCGHGGVAGVSAKDGRLLWETTEWKISIATVPSPVVVGDGRVFLSGGYNAGSLMLQVRKEGDRFVAKTLFKLEPEIFGSTQQTPILYQDHIYGARADGKFTCLNLDGKVVWATDATQQFGLGPYLLADGLIYAINDSGLLRLFPASPQKYELLAQARILNGRESWGPMALAGGRLIARDLTRMVCLDIAER